MCPRTNELHLAGEDCRFNAKGMFLITTNNDSPFASGQWNVQPSSSSKYPTPNSRRDPFLEQIDEYGKLDSAFNYVNSYPKAIASVSQQHDQLSHLNFINENDYYQSNNDDKSRIDLNDDAKLATSTERWRQNDKFIFVENPLTAAFNRTIPLMHHHHQQQSGSSEFQFPKVTYR